MELITDHEFEECSCEVCGECVFEVAPEKKPPDRYCRKLRGAHARKVLDTALVRS